jgi:hypothetical protein
LCRSFGAMGGSGASRMAARAEPGRRCPSLVALPAKGGGIVSPRASKKLTRIAAWTYPICFVLLMIVDAPYIIHTCVCALVMVLALVQIFAGDKRWQLVGIAVFALYGVLFVEFLGGARQDARNEARVQELRERIDHEHSAALTTSPSGGGR